jgi:hypothetical protein
LPWIAAKAAIAWSSSLPTPPSGTYPFPCHDDGAEIGRHYLRDIIKYFDLPAEIFD